MRYYQEKGGRLVGCGHFPGHGRAGVGAVEEGMGKGGGERSKTSEATHLHRPCRLPPKHLWVYAAGGANLGGGALPLVPELISGWFRRVPMVTCAWNPQSSPVQDRFFGGSLGSHTLGFPHYTWHKHSGPRGHHVPQNWGVTLSQLTLFPPMVWGKEPNLCHSWDGAETSLSPF